MQAERYFVFHFHGVSSSDGKTSECPPLILHSELNTLNPIDQNAKVVIRPSIKIIFDLPSWFDHQNLTGQSVINQLKIFSKENSSVGSQLVPHGLFFQKSEINRCENYQRF